MSYSLESLSDGCYENSSVLINKFDIKDQKLLDQIEQSITSALIAKAKELIFAILKKLKRMETAYLID